jgi:lysophospholipase L1-like esterase
MALVPTTPPRFERYVAIGDSSTEGLLDPDGAGGYRGWSQRLAERIAAAQGSLLYANLAVRGLRTREIRETQLDRAVNLRPDLATLFAGTNDVTALRCDADAVAREMAWMLRSLRATGATVLTFTLPDLASVMPLARLISPRIRALNASLRCVAKETGALVVDFAALPVAIDPRLWSDDRIHANAAGHERIAAALARALDLPGSDDAWRLPLPESPPRTPARAMLDELAWMRRHLLPWAWDAWRGRAKGAALRCRRPELAPFSASVFSD